MRSLSIQVTYKENTIINRLARFGRPYTYYLLLIVCIVLH
jgi:hypothetical protein